MTTRGDSLGVGGRMDVGVGVSVPPPPPEQPAPTEEIIYKSWQHGLITSASPETIPADSAQQAIDVRISRNDSLMRMEGISLSADNTPHSMLYLFQHASLDFSTELVVIDPPYVGHRSVGAWTFDNNGIAASGEKGWVALDVAGTLLFSNGTTATYSRQPGGVVVTDLSADIIADTFATSFGRVFAGAYTDPISGYQSLGVFWNGTGTPPESDWASLNSGQELLLANQQEADRVIAMRAIGFDALAILTRKMIWMGYETGQANHPAAFRLRFPARGCVAEPTAVVCPYGVIALSDDGVVLINLNTAEIISTQINDSLIPLNYLQLSSYRATYDGKNDRYVLATPTGTWYYEFPRIDELTGIGIPGRWYFSSFVADSLVMFTDQNGNVFWNTVQGTWAQQTLTWAEMSVGELKAPPVLYFGSGTELGFEDSLSYTYLGTPQNPIWVTKQSSQHSSDLVATVWFELEYRSTMQSQVEFATADEDDNFVYARTITLPTTNDRRKSVVFGFTGVSTGTAVRLRYVDKLAEIHRVRQVFLPYGPKQVAIA